jgi:polysaccharide export outer membrane protein
MRQIFVAVAAVLALCLIGCMPKTHTNTINQFNAEYQRVSSGGYKIEPGDTLDITFFYTPEYNSTSVPVRPDGKIQLSVVGDFPIAGMTPDQAAAELKKAYSSQLKNPDLAVQVKSFGANSVVVQGEVRTPGEIPLTGNATVLQMIGRAGSFLPTADLRHVTVVRHSTGGAPLVVVLDLLDAMQGVNPGMDVPVLAGDMVYVPTLLAPTQNPRKSAPESLAPAAASPAQ